MSRMSITATSISPTQNNIKVHVDFWESASEGYAVFFNTTGFGNSATLLYQSKVNDQVYQHKNLTPNTTYYYIVKRVLDSGAITDTMDQTSVKTPAAYVAPSMPSITASLLNETTATITARVSSYGNPSTGQLSIVAKRDDGPFIELDATATHSLTATFPNLIEGSTYTFAAVAVNDADLTTISSFAFLVIEENGRIRVRVGNEWKKGVPYVRQGGVWKKGKMYVRSGGAWQKSK